MTIRELIERLAAIAATEGDVDIIFRTGQMDDLYPVTNLEVVNINKRGEGIDAYYSYPWRESDVTNAKAVYLS